MTILVSPVDLEMPDMPAVDDDGHGRSRLFNEYSLRNTRISNGFASNLGPGAG
jgi:hypothetical protein